MRLVRGGDLIAQGVSGDGTVCPRPRVKMNTRRPRPRPRPRPRVKMKVESEFIFSHIS